VSRIYVQYYWSGFLLWEYGSQLVQPSARPYDGQLTRLVVGIGRQAWREVAGSAPQKLCNQQCAPVGVACALEPTANRGRGHGERTGQGRQVSVASVPKAKLGLELVCGHDASIVTLATTDCLYRENSCGNDEEFP
jgi:hypothetical protein